MAELNFPNIAGNFQSGYAFGTKMREDRQAQQDNAALRGLAPQVIAGDPNAFDQAAAINPEAAQQFQSAGDTQLRRLKGAMDYFDQGLQSDNDQLIQARFREIRPFLSRLTGSPGPETWDASMRPAFEQAKTRIAMADTGTGDELKSLRIGANGNYWAIRGGQFVDTGTPAQPDNQIVPVRQPDGSFVYQSINKGVPTPYAIPVAAGAPQPTPQGPPAVSDFQAIDQSTGQPITDPAEIAAIQASIPAFSGGQPQPQPSGVLTGAPQPRAAPAGYEPSPEGGLRPIPGGPAQVAIDARADAAAARKAAEDVKTEQKRQVSTARQVEAATAANQLVSAIDGLMKHPGFDSLGSAWGDAQINIPLVRNDAKDAKARLENISGQVALSTMARLKSLSATGATGFGSLTAPELKLLQNSIDTLQSENISNKQLTDSLTNIRNFMDQTANWKPQQDQPQTPSAAPQPGTIQDGYRFRGGDPADQNSWERL